MSLGLLTPSFTLRKAEETIQIFKVIISQDMGPEVTFDAESINNLLACRDFIGLLIEAEKDYSNLPEKLIDEQETCEAIIDRHKDPSQDQLGPMINKSITSWATLRDAFEDRYKPSEDAFALLSRITHLKEENETMRDFIARFNALINRVPVAVLPMLENQKCFFVNAMSSKLALEAPPVNALAEIEEEEQYYGEPSSQGEDDQDVSEPTGDSTIGYMEFDEEESDEEEGTQGYASEQSYAVFTYSQGKEPEVATHVQQEKAVSNTPPVIAKRGNPLPTQLPDKSFTRKSFPLISPLNQSSHVPIKTSNPILPSRSEGLIPSPTQPLATFDIIDHAKKTKIQMSEAEYLQSNPEQL
ncbi:hypothetical protein KI387_037175, partial [Taxus chinensis]